MNGVEEGRGIEKKGGRSVRQSGRSEGTLNVGWAKEYGPCRLPVEKGNETFDGQYNGWNSDGRWMDQ